MKKKYKIAENRRKEEIGGVILGRWTGGLPKYEIIKFLQFENAEKPEDRYKYYSLPRVNATVRIFLQLLWLNLFKKQKGATIIGTWHSHPDGSKKPSMTDKLMMTQLLKRNERYLLGISCNREMNVYLYERKK